MPTNIQVHTRKYPRKHKVPHEHIDTLAELVNGKSIYKMNIITQSQTRQFADVAAWVLPSLQGGH